MYAVIDNAAAYGNITNYARRGMLFTNNRETVVIQDEIAFKGVQSCAWVAHTEATISLSTDKKTAIFTAKVNGQNKYIRLTLLSDNPKLKFETMTCGIGEDDFLMDGANRPGWSESKGGVSEYSRTGFNRVVVKADNVLVLNMAVVIEVINAPQSEDPVQYKYTAINKWTIDEKFDGVIGGQESDNTTISTAKMTDIKSYGAQARKLIETGYALTTRVNDFFRNLVRVNVAVNTYRPETFKDIETIQSAYLDYLTYMNMFKAYRDSINEDNKIGASIGAQLSLI
jgi:hypothetical protein